MKANEAKMKIFNDTVDDGYRYCELGTQADMDRF